MDRIKLINYLISRYGFKNYLEIGCEYNICFNSVQCENKTGVDPERGGTHRMTSDHFFKVNNREMKFDIIFIDGLHHSNQVVRDISNSLECLIPGGIIALHDCNPTTPELAAVPRPTPHTWWNGDVWKAIVFYRQIMSLDIVVGDFDFGCGIIRQQPNTAPLFTNEWWTTLTYEKLEQYRPAWLRAIPFEDVVRWLEMGDQMQLKLRNGTLFQSQQTILPNIGEDESHNSSVVEIEDESHNSSVEVYEVPEETVQIVEMPDDAGTREFSLNIADLL